MINFVQSILLIALMAVDRYITVVVRISRTRPKPPIYTNICCLIVWLISFAMVSPIIMYTSTQVTL